MSISVNLNDISFRVLFDKNCFRIFCCKNIFVFWRWKWPAQGTSTVPIVSAHFRSLFCWRQPGFATSNIVSLVEAMNDVSRRDDVA